MSKFDFKAVILRLKKTDLALPLANIAKNDFVNNFAKEGFDGVKWKEPKRKIPGEPAYEYPKNKGLSRRTKPTLSMSGRLRRDVVNSVNTGHKNSLLSYTLVVNNPYAEYHDMGTKTLPRRQIVGTTEALNKKLLDRIMAEFDKIW